MKEKNRIENIKAGIVVVNQKELKVSVNGERLNDYESHFNELYWNKINQLCPHGNWGVFFKQIDEHRPKFIVDIFTDDINEYALIYETIRVSPPLDIEIEIMGRYWGFAEFLRQSGQLSHS